MNFFRRIYSFDYMGHKKWWFTISGIIIAAGLISLFVKGGGNPVDGLNYGLEFKEGTRIAVAFETRADPRRGPRDVVAEAGYSDAQIQETPNVAGSGEAGFQIQTRRAHAGGAGRSSSGALNDAVHASPRPSGTEIFSSRPWARPSAARS